MNIKALALTTLAVTLSSSVVHAASFSSVDVVFLVDESGSMGGEHAFLQSVISNLDTDLATAGVSTRQYGVVGFGSSANAGDPRDISGGLLDLTGGTTALNNLVTSGSTEDGYEAIQFALDTYTFTSTARNFILVTDEDRDVTSSDTFATVLANMAANNVILNAVVNQNIFNVNNTAAIGMDEDGTTYTADGSGGFVEEAGGSLGSGAGSTTADYADLAFDTGGAVWDLGILRTGGNNALSFGSAFLDIKVQEVTSQINQAAVPVPAGLPLALTGLASLAYLRRRAA